jgi:hypothetical protein
MVAEDGILVASDATDSKKIPGLHILPPPEHKKNN